MHVLIFKVLKMTCNALTKQKLNRYEISRNNDARFSLDAEVQQVRIYRGKKNLLEFCRQSHAAKLSE